MATENTQEVQENQPSETTKTGMAMLGGLGVTLMMVGAGIGVVLPDVDSQIIGLIVLLGAGLLGVAVAGWVISVRPHEHFDDINVPIYHGHHHEDGDDAH